jgi:hypothetical protein
MRAAAILAPDFQILKIHPVASHRSRQEKGDSAVDTLSFVWVPKQGVKKENGAV